MQMLGMPTHLCRIFGTKPVVVLGTAAMAVPVLMMPPCSLHAFEWLSLAYLVLMSLVRCSHRKRVFLRPPATPSIPSTIAPPAGSNDGRSVELLADGSTVRDLFFFPCFFWG